MKGEGSKKPLLLVKLTAIVVNAVPGYGKRLKAHDLYSQEYTQNKQNLISYSKILEDIPENTLVEITIREKETKNCEKCNKPFAPRKKGHSYCTQCNNYLGGFA